ncbi:MAG: hypothetical protein JETCAE03_33470 [Ignavibacteriaceae bacterium]|nr:MAG: hypothetical protein JETCAE03_33470 [Ignavibacteriaceae bacterium]
MKKINLDFLKEVPKNKRKKLLEYIQYSYKPNKKILEWGMRMYGNQTNALTAKLGMFYEQNKNQFIIKENLKSEFPEIKSWNNNKRFSSLYWTVITKKDWKMNRAEDFQDAAGYSPMGYGGPYEFQSKKNDDGTYTITWHCGATS